MLVEIITQSFINAFLFFNPSFHFLTICFSFKCHFKNFVKAFFFLNFFNFSVDLLISKVKKKKMRKRREKAERAGKDLRGRGEDFGGVADELRRRRRSRNFPFHGSPAERTYAGDLRRGSWRKRRRTPSCARAFWPTGRVKQQLHLNPKIPVQIGPSLVLNWASCICFCVCFGIILGWSVCLPFE
jgi:hypothetical protein